MADPDRNKFAVLWRPKRIWAIASVHGDAQRLSKLHQLIAERFALGDRVVYLGNLMGHGHAILATLNNMMAFRRAAISGLGMVVSDVAVLRGAQEEMWQKMLQLQFALNPAEVMEWMLDQGVAATLEAYGGNAQEGLRSARTGASAISRWTSAVRARMDAMPGHTALLGRLRRAAFTEPDAADGKRVLFVHAGLDMSRPLAAQSDSFWWANEGFNQSQEPYGDFCKVVRGFDHRRVGLDLGAYTISIDGGCGFGGPLLALCLAPDGEALEVLEA